MRILSGIQATGKLHIGNYLGMVKPFVEMQDKGEAFYFIPNLHSLNVRPDPATLRQDTLANVAWFIACGVDLEQSVIFAQSHVPAHSELCWILNNYVTMGELSRMTQYKDKSSKGGAEGELVALFTYPVLMAADILLYGADIIPVGEDQKQHVELARDIAERFNNLYGPTFVVPRVDIQSVGARVMSLQDPSKKMSKSDPNQSGNVMLLDPSETIQDKIKRAVTDSDNRVVATDDKPAITNLLQIYAGFSNEGIQEIEAKYVNKGYGDFKSDLAVLVSDQLNHIQARYHQLMGDTEALLTILDQGAKKANQIAESKLQEVKQKLGLL